MAITVLHERFEIFRNDNYRWFNVEMVQCSKACIILHNLTIWINEAGISTKDIVEDSGLVAIISKIYEEEYYLSGRHWE